MIFVMFSTKSFLPRAMVAYNSIKKHHPYDDIDLSVIENSELINGYVPNMPRMRLEKCLEHLRTGKEVISIGADCVLYRSLPNFSAAITLIPHVIKFPKDNNSFYKCGHINADLVALKPIYETIEAVKWLLTQPLTLGPNEFYEQTHLSSLPFLMKDVHINRDKTVNVAYFNLHERALSITKNGYYLVNGNLLTMFQFSGWCPEKLSVYWANPIITPELKQLMLDYQTAVASYEKSVLTS